MYNVNGIERHCSVQMWQWDKQRWMDGLESWQTHQVGLRYATGFDFISSRSFSIISFTNDWTTPHHHHLFNLLQLPIQEPTMCNNNSCIQISFCVSVVYLASQSIPDICCCGSLLALPMGLHITVFINLISTNLTSTVLTQFHSQRHWSLFTYLFPWVEVGRDDKVTSLILSTMAKLVNCSADMDDKLINLWEEYPMFICATQPIGSDEMRSVRNQSLLEQYFIAHVPLMMANRIPVLRIH